MLRVLRCLPALLLAAAIPAGAVTITANGSTVFSDGFESGNFSNPTSGVWSFIQNGVTVTNAGSPGPADGSFYASLFRDANSNGGTLAGMIGTGLSGGIGSGEVLMKMMVYIPSAADGLARAQFLMESGQRDIQSQDFNTARTWVRTDGQGFVQVVGPGFATTETQVPYTTNVWQEWDIDYLIGSSTFSLAVNGVTQSGLPSFTSGRVDFIEFDNGIASSGSFFLDGGEAATLTTGTPEPATLAYGVSGLVLLLWRFRRSG